MTSKGPSHTQPGCASGSRSSPGDANSGCGLTPVGHGKKSLLWRLAARRAPLTAPIQSWGASSPFSPREHQRALARRSH